MDTGINYVCSNPQNNDALMLPLICKGLASSTILLLTCMYM